MLRARLIAGLPADLVGSLTGLTQGHFPVHAKARYADDLAERDMRAPRPQGPPRAQRRQARRLERPPPLDQHLQPPRRAGDRRQRRRRQEDRQEHASSAASSSCRTSTATATPTRTSARSRSATRSRRASTTRAPATSSATPRAAASRARCPSRPRPPAPARRAHRRQPAAAALQRRLRAPRPPRAAQAPATEKERLFANPARPRNRPIAEETGQLLDQAGFEVFRVYFSKVLRLSRREVKLKTLKKGVDASIGGTVLGRDRQARRRAPARSSRPHLNFSIRPAGRGAPRIDPKPILDGWKLLEATAIYRAAGKNPFVGPSAAASARCC